MSSEKIKQGSGSASGLRFSLRIALTFTLFFTVGIVGLLGLAYLMICQSVHSQETAAVNYRLDEYRAWFQEGGIEALENRFEEQNPEIPEVLFVRVLASDGEVNLIKNMRGTKFLEMSELQKLPADLGGGRLVLGEADPQTWTVVSRPVSAGMIIQVGKNSEESELILRHFRRMLGFGVVPVLLLSFIGGALVSYRSLTPIRSLVATIQQALQTGEMDQRVEEKSESGEFEDLIALFNDLLEKNQRLVATMHDSLDSVAHDLRTPMTRLRATAEHALGRPGGTPEQRDALADCLEESDEIILLLQQLMESAEVEAGTMQLDLGEVWIAELFQSVNDLYEFVAEERRVTLSFDAPEKLVIVGDRRRLQRLLANLVDNAIKYGAENSTVTVRATEEEEEICITVRDKGEGIPIAEQSRIWERLYRGDQSRSQRGLGLGLSFVRGIAEAHGGRVEVESLLGEGADFRVWLPLSGGQL